MKRILFILGSNRAGSFNRQLLEAIKEQLAGKADVADLDFADVPFINQDLEFPTPEPVQRIRDEVMAADALWIVSPQYNDSYPGLVKNVIDWLSRPMKQGAPGNAIKGKKVTFTGIGGRSATGGMREKLGILVRYLRMDPLDENGLGLSLAPAAWGSGVVELDDEQKAAIKDQVDRFLAFIEE